MKGTHGFTLLEMIVSMVIVSVIVLAVYTAYSTVTRTWSASQEQTARFRLDVRWADGLSGFPDHSFDHQCCQWSRRPRRTRD